MIDASSETRCPHCGTVLVHSGAICVICDDERAYEAPIRSSPPLRMPSEDEQDAEANTRHAVRF